MPELSAAFATKRLEKRLKYPGTFSFTNLTRGVRGIPTGNYLLSALGDPPSMKDVEDVSVQD